MGHFSWTWTWVSFGNLNCFLAKKEVFGTKTQQLGFKKMVQRGQKSIPEVADGNHGGLGCG